MYVTVFDFDGTLVSVEGLDGLFTRSVADDPACGVRGAEFAGITDEGMAGEIPAEASLAGRLAVLRPGRRLVGEVGLDISRRLTPPVARQPGFFRENAGRSDPRTLGRRRGADSSRPGPDRDPPEHLLAHRFSCGPGGGVTGLDPATAMVEGGQPAAIRRAPRDRGPVWMVGDGATGLELRTLGLVDRFVAFTENRRREPVVRMAGAVADSMEAPIGLLPCP